VARVDSIRAAETGSLEATKVGTEGVAVKTKDVVCIDSPNRCGQSIIESQEPRCTRLFVGRLVQEIVASNPGIPVGSAK